jgi:xanthine dehydrogenase molybdopterin-binding subunit B
MARAASSIADADVNRPWVGRSIERVEDAALLTGRGHFIDDLGTRPGTLHAAILRSPHAHADIVTIDASAARAAPGVAAILTGEDIKKMTASLVVGVKAPVECWPIAVGRVRYVGEPVAIIVASDRYMAEDAADLIQVEYRARPAIVDPLAALLPDAPALHEGSMATWRAIVLSVTVIRGRPSPKLRIAFRSISDTHVTLVRRLKPMVWLPITIRRRTRSTFWQISKDHSAFTQ